MNARNQKRVEIMLDVLDQIIAKRITPTRGVYVGGQNDSCRVFKKVSDTKKVPRCEACAIGSVFLSALSIHNKFEEFVRKELVADCERKNEEEIVKDILHYDSLSDDSMLDYLAPYFDDVEMREMEKIFERDRDSIYAPDPANVLASIATFIIANRGEWDAWKYAKEFAIHDVFLS